MRRLLVGLAVGLVAAASISSMSGSASAAAAGSPIGRLDSIRLQDSSVVLTGWALDRDHPAGSQIYVYRTTPKRALYGSTKTTIVRTDVNRAEHVTGAHGWTFSTPAYPGSQTWCAVGINVGAGADTSLGCRTITVPTGHLATGAVDSINDDGIVTQLSGWALDGDDLRDPESVDIYRVSPSSAFIGRAHTTVARPDVNARFKVAGTHGWTAQLPDLPGQASRYCAYALNRGPVAANPRIGCVDVAAGPAAGTISASSVQAFATTASITVSVVALPGKPTLRVTRQVSTVAGDGWTAPVVSESALPSTRYVTVSDSGLKPNTTYRYSFFLHDAAGSHTVAYQVDVTTAQIAVPS